MVCIRTRDVVQQRIAIFTFLRVKLSLAGTDRTVVFNWMSAQRQIFKQNAADKLVKAMTVTGTVMVFQDNCVAVVAAQEQIAVGVRRTHPVRGQMVVKRKHNRRLVEVAIRIRLLTTLETDCHLGKADERQLQRLLQQVGAYRFGHTDDMPWRGGQVAVGCIHKNISIGIDVQYRVFAYCSHHKTYLHFAHTAQGRLG